MSLLRLLLAPTTPLLAPALRICLLTWLLFERFGGAGRHLRASLEAHAPSLLHAPHLEAVLGVFGAWPMSRGFMDALGEVLVIATVCAIVGLGTRVALAVVACCFVVYYGVISGWGFFNHTPAIGAQLVIALAVVPGTTAWSIDRALLTWWRRRRHRRRHRRHPEVHAPAPRWRDGLAPPVPRFGDTVLLLVVGSLYFASGLAKLRYGGWFWLDGDILQFYLSGGAGSADTWLGPADSTTISAYVYGAQTTPWVRWLATSSLAMVALSWLTVVVEAGAPVFLLLGRWWRLCWCLAAAGFHVAVRLMMGIGFTMWIWTDLLIGALAVVDIVAHRRRRQRQRPSAQQPTQADALAVGVGEAPRAGDVDGVGIVDADARPAHDP